MSAEKRKEDLGREDTEGLKAFEAALAALAPRADRIDRDRLMFLAGQQSRPQSRVGQAQRSPTNYSTAWKWPAAFSAMTTVAAALAILLAIRPAAPQAAGGGSTNIAGNESAPPAVQASNINEPPAWTGVDREANEKLQPAPPLLTLLQSVWKPGDAGSAAAEMPARGEAQLSYRALLDSILRRDSDSRKLAGVFPSRIPPDISAPPTSRGLLKEYLLDSK
jgi:hypothetical protein